MESRNLYIGNAMAAAIGHAKDQNSEALTAYLGDLLHDGLAIQREAKPGACFYWVPVATGCGSHLSVTDPALIRPYGPVYEIHITSINDRGEPFGYVLGKGFDSRQEYPHIKAPDCSAER